MDKVKKELVNVTLHGFESASAVVRAE